MIKKMIQKLILTISMLVLPMTLFGQSTLNFPRAYTPSDLTTTGFAIVNPGAVDANVTFTLLSASGATVASSTQVVRGRGQLARLGSEIFPGASGTGWVQATSATTGLQGCWEGGDFSTYTDGADGAIPSADQILPLVAGQTEINIANPGNSAISVTMAIRGPNGVDSSAAVIQSIPALGVFQAQATAVFPSANFSLANHIRLTGTGPFAATSVITGYLAPKDTGVINAVDASATTLSLNFPQVVNGTFGSQNYDTVVGATNLTATDQIVTLAFTSENGGAPISVQRTLSANGTIRESASSLFGFANVYENGSVTVTGTLPITGFVAYTETTGGGFAVIPVQATPKTEMLFMQIADLPPWYTGVALLNKTSTAADVEVYAIYPEGGLVGGAANVQSAHFTINPGAKFSKLLGQEIVGTSVNGGFVYVRSTNNVPLYGLQLFFARSGSFLANAAAGNLTTGISFTPPVLSTLSSLGTARTTRGTTLTLSGANFSTIAGNNIVVFKTASGTIDVAASTATSSSITVVVPAGAISGPVGIRVNGQPTATFVLEITASASALDQNSVVVVSGQTSAGVDIYVPAPAGGTLNMTQVAVVDVGATNYTFTNTANLQRGETKDVAVSGVGMTAANGSGISFSGEGLNVSNIRYQTVGTSTLIVVQISVDANAEVGPRNIGIKNTNLDETILSGGLFVR